MSVMIVRFRAGAETYGIAAGCILDIAPARPEVPHLACVLGGGVPEVESGRRTLTIVSNRRMGEVTVDSPIEIMELNADDIAPCRTSTSSIALGFVRREGGVFALLDAERVVDLLLGPTVERMPEIMHEDVG